MPPDTADPEMVDVEPVEPDGAEPEAVETATSGHEPTRDDVDALIGAATPHFAYQLRARVEELVHDLPEGHDVRTYAEQKMSLLDSLGHASSKAAEGQRESPDRLGWDELPAAPADAPLARRTATQ